MIPARPDPDAEVDVAQDAVLRDVEADSDRGRVALADLEVDVHHRRVERRLVRVGDVVLRRHEAGRREGHARRTALAAARRPRIGEVHHHAEPGLETGRPLRQHEDRTRGAVPDDADRPPDGQRPRDAVAASGHQHEATGRAGGGLVQGRLEQRGVIGTGLRVRRVDVHRGRVVGTQGEHGRRRGRVRHGQERETDDQELAHGAVCSIPAGRTTPAAG